MNSDPGKKKDGRIKTAVGKIKTKIKTTYEKYEDKRARRDIIFTETITPKPEEKPPVLVRGGIDIQLLVLAVALLVIGGIMSFSASSAYAEQFNGDSLYYFKRHILFAIVSIIGTSFFVIYAKPNFWRMFGVGVYALSIVLLIAVLIVGTAGGGAKRWLDFKVFTLQPSELAKMAVIMMLALYMSHYEKEIKSVHARGGSFRHGVLIPGLIIGLVLGLVMLEKHISGTIIIGLIGFAVMYLGGTRNKWMLTIIAVLAVTALFLVIVSSYAQVRVETWLKIFNADAYGDEFKRGSAWQTLQGLYATGSGGFFGRGLGQSIQKFGYVSQPQNDFVFTILCEELGFVGAAIVIGLFALLVYRGFKIAARCPDKYMRLVAYGLSFKLALQTILNIFVVTNLMPNTGVSLPFFSSGGTFLAVQVFEIGILLSISRYSAEKKN